MLVFECVFKYISVWNIYNIYDVYPLCIKTLDTFISAYDQGLLRCTNTSSEGGGKIEVKVSKHDETHSKQRVFF